MELTRVIRPAMSLPARMASARREAWRLAMVRAAAMPLPETSPRATPSLPSGKGEKIVVVAADAKRGAAATEIIESGDFWQVLGKKALLHFACDFDFAV